MPKLSFLDNKSVEHEVGDKPLPFYPLRLSTVLKLRNVARPIGVALSKIFANKKSDVEEVFRHHHDESGRVVGSETKVSAVDMRMASFRDEQRTAAIEDLITRLTDPEILKTIVEFVIMDSLRDHFTRDQVKAESEGMTFICPDEVSAFIDETPIDAMAKLIVGVAKANKDVFGPLGEKVVQAVENVDLNAAFASPNLENQTTEAGTS